jgi:hypothetical protein
MSINLAGLKAMERYNHRHKQLLFSSRNMDFDLQLNFSIDSGIFNHEVSMSESGCGIELITPHQMSNEIVIQFQQFWNSNARLYDTDIGFYCRDGNKVIFTPKNNNLYLSEIYFIVDPFYKNK